MTPADLNAMTVVNLKALAKENGMKGYSKLRKAELIEAILTHMTPEVAEIDVEAMVLGALAEVMAEAAAEIETEQESAPAEVAPVAFSHTPIKAPESHAKARTIATPQSGMGSEEKESLDDLKTAYRNMRKTINGMGNTPRRVVYAGRARIIAGKLAGYGIKAHLL